MTESHAKPGNVFDFFYSIKSLSALGEGGGGGSWVNFCWVCAAGLSEPLPHYSLFCGQL